MNCQETRSRFHAWWDGELPGRQAREVELHLEDCVPCAGYRREMEVLREFLQEGRKLPEPLAAELWRTVRPGSRPSLWREALSSAAGAARDLLRVERRSLITKLAAAPITLLLFVLISSQFSISVWQSWTYPLHQVSEDTTRRPAEPVMVQVLQSKHEVRSLVDMAWKLPFEDSVSVVAGIQPDGHAQIESILEHPRSFELMRAVDHTLRNSRFEQARAGADSVVIYSFQKIDVYGGF